MEIRYIQNARSGKVHQVVYIGNVGPFVLEECNIDQIDVEDRKERHPSEPVVGDRCGHCFAE